MSSVPSSRCFQNIHSLRSDSVRKTFNPFTNRSRGQEVEYMSCKQSHGCPVSHMFPLLCYNTEIPPHRSSQSPFLSTWNAVTIFELPNSWVAMSCCVLFIICDVSSMGDYYFSGSQCMKHVCSKQHMMMTVAGPQTITHENWRQTLLAPASLQLSLPSWYSKYVC